MPDAITLLITLGPTREYIDPVRYISNASSGTMGRALVRSALRRAWKVIAVCGPGIEFSETARGLTVVPVISARDMFAAVKKYFRSADIVIGTAAVADYRVPTTAINKLSRSHNAHMTLRLVPNPDIIAWAGRRKGARTVGGFALETHDMISHARAKLARKGLDFIFANTPAAIGSRSVSGSLIKPSGRIVSWVSLSKIRIAERILNEAHAIHAAPRRPARGR